MTSVVNIYHKKPYDVFVGRQKSGLHWGNPFSHLDNSAAAVKVGSREEAIQAFRDWIAGTAHTEVEPQRREWIIANVQHLKNKVLACYCSPKSCHGDVLAEMANNCL